MTSTFNPDLARKRPARLLTQNSELRRIGVWNWTLPALAARLPDGRTVRTCPSAGVCGQVCYARNGSYTWPVVKTRHLANLAYVLDDPIGWEEQMVAELGARRHYGGWVRVHDAGDFLSPSYLAAWLRIMHARPEVSFYCYTKEISLFREVVEPDPPANFRWIYSYGGIEDHLLGPEDRVADVFPDEAAVAAAGWYDQSASDLLAVLGPAPVGIPANRIPRFQRRQGQRTLREWQAERDGRPGVA